MYFDFKASLRSEHRLSWPISEVSIVWEGPLGDVRLLVSQVMKRVGLPPLVSLVILIDVASLGPGNAIEGSDSCSAKTCQCPEHCALLFCHLSTLKLVDHFIGLLDAEVAEEKRAVFRALTRLRGAAITSFDGVARSQTGNIDEYNKTHKWRKTHPLHHLADEESDISKWAFPDNADF
jgi:hypothetical protein